MGQILAAIHSLVNRASATEPGVGRLQQSGVEKTKTILKNAE